MEVLAIVGDTFQRDQAGPMNRATSTHDPELDPPFSLQATARPRPRAGRRPLLPEETQRLVANPFLAVVGYIALAWLLPFAYLHHNFPLVVVSCAGFVVTTRLFHYHCLDCGATGRLGLWRHHACTTVQMRRSLGIVRRWRGPNPTVQTGIWIILIFSVAVLGVVAYLTIQAIVMVQIVQVMI